MIMASDRGRESARKHSPSLRTGRADLPHPALQSVVLPPRGVMSDARDRGRPHRGFGGKPHPRERVITMGNSQRASARPRRRRVEHPTGSARRHWGRGVCSLPRCSPSTFLRPLAPGPLRPFFATMDALTPARSVLAVLGLFPAATRSAPHEQVSLIPTLGLPTIPSPTTCGRFVSPRKRPIGRPRRKRRWPILQSWQNAGFGRCLRVTRRNLLEAGHPPQSRGSPTPA